MFIISLEISLKHGFMEKISHGFTIFSYLLLLFDILVTLNTAYYEKGVPVKNRRKIL